MLSTITFLIVDGIAGCWPQQAQLIQSTKNATWLISAVWLDTWASEEDPEKLSSKVHTASLSKTVDRYYLGVHKVNFQSSY